VESSISAELVNDEVIVIEATSYEMQEILSNPSIIGVEINSKVEISGDRIPNNLVIIGEDKIENASTTGALIKIAIIDTGIDIDNPNFHVEGIAAELWTMDITKTQGMVKAQLIAYSKGESDISILDAYQVYQDEIDKIQVEVEDNLSEINYTKYPNAKVSILAEVNQPSYFTLGDTIEIGVKFSHNHTKVVAKLMKSDSDTPISEDEVSGG